MEKFRYHPFEIKEGRKLIITAKCENCNWRSSLPTTTARLASDSGLLQDKACEHEVRFNHKVEFKVV